MCVRLYWSSNNGIVSGTVGLRGVGMAGFIILSETIASRLLQGRRPYRDAGLTGTPALLRRRLY
ncbi:MAG: hypothetical protein JXA20_06580 [Spirochaetes bacterium]|nr:hypothetical protein [Spirochaetota bacterium]